MNPLIRPEAETDKASIYSVNCAAFGQFGEARLVDALREADHLQLSLVAEVEQQVVGHIAFSDVQIITKTRVVPALALAPMAVLPDYQRQGIGSNLVTRGLEECRKAGHSIVLVVGHPEFYPRFGFSFELAKHLEIPYPRDAFMALELVPGALAHVAGRVEYSRPFLLV